MNLQRASDAIPDLPHPMPCAGRGCPDRWSCIHGAADEFAGLREVRMTCCPVVNGERLYYVPIPSRRPLSAQVTDWGSL